MNFLWKSPKNLISGRYFCDILCDIAVKWAKKRAIFFCDCDMQCWCGILLHYSVISFNLDTLQTLFFIESMNIFWKTICRSDKEDCAINLRCWKSFFVWRQFSLTSKNKILFFSFFFAKVFIFVWNVEKVEKKNLVEKFSFEIRKNLEIFS